MDSIPTSNKLSSLINEDVDAVAIDAPENLMFFSADELIENYDDLTSDAKIAILSELLVRYSFNTSNSELNQVLLKFLPEESLAQFKSWVQNHNPSYEPKPPINLIPDNTLISDEERERLTNLENCIFERLKKLYGICAGLLPVVANDVGEAIAIPFTLEYANEEIDPLKRVVDLDNASFPEWSRAVSDIVKDDKTPDFKLFLPNFIRVRLLFHSSITNIQVNGNSLQFPILLAHWRWRNKKLLPIYSPFSIIATGEIDEGRLRPVEALQKFNSLKEQYDLQTFFCPSSSGISLNSDPLLTIINANTSIKDIVSICQDKIETLVKERSAKNIILNSDYISNRINVISISAKKDLESQWDQLIDTLLLVEKKIKSLQNTEEKMYLDCIISLSFAYCHSGRTAEAIKYNEIGREFAKEHNLTDKLYGLLIHQLVLFQDIDDLSSVPKLANEIYSQISQADNPPENPDNRANLLMQYHGTMAQIHIYGTLAKIKGFSENEAIENAEKAIEYARERKKIAEGNSKTGNIVDDNKNATEMIDDIVRDMNYLHLCYAVFTPGSEDELRTFEEARDYLQENSNQIEDKAYNNNLQFQFRQRCLAAYFQILKDNQCCDGNIINEKYPPVKEPFNYLKALSFKYLGAINAFYGNSEEAKKLFEEAIKLLENETSPLFQFICMTIAAEAYRSFSKLGDQQTAEQYRQIAKKLFSDNSNFNTFHISQRRWAEFLESSWEEFDASGEDFPGLHYYY